MAPPEEEQATAGRLLVTAKAMADNLTEVRDTEHHRPLGDMDNLNTVNLWGPLIATGRLLLRCVGDVAFSILWVTVWSPAA